MNRVERSSVELLQELVHEAQRLVHLELDLAKQELKELAMRNGIAVGLLAAGAVLILLGVLVALPVLVVLLVPDHVLAAEIWLAGYIVVGALLVLAGRLVLRLEAPPRTRSSLEETKRWALRQIKSNER